NNIWRRPYRRMAGPSIPNDRMAVHLQRLMPGSNPAAQAPARIGTAPEADVGASSGWKTAELAAALRGAGGAVGADLVDAGAVGVDDVHGERQLAVAGARAEARDRQLDLLARAGNARALRHRLDLRVDRLDRRVEPRQRLL